MVSCKHERKEIHMIDDTHGSQSCADCGQPLLLIVPKWITEALERAIRSQAAKPSLGEPD